MGFKSIGDDKIERIQAAQQKVAEAMKDVSRGGSVEKLNRANRELADAHNANYSWRAGIVPSDKF